MRSRLVVIAMGLAIAWTSSADDQEVFTVWSDSIEIDRPYKSMFGPWRDAKQSLGGNSKGLVWLTGFKSTVTDENGSKRLSQKFMCHTNVAVSDMQDRIQHLGGHVTTVSNPYKVRSTRVDGRIFVISQGQTEIQLPKGFGIPVQARTEIRFFNQALNLHHQGLPIDLRYKNEIIFDRDEHCNKEMTPLYMNVFEIMASLSSTSSFINVSNPPDIPEEVKCAPGAPAGSMSQADTLGQHFTSHWILKPGRETRHTLVTASKNIPVDTRIHYIFIHVHPFAESLSLVDLTDNKVLFEGKVTTRKDGSIQDTPIYSSEDGLPIYHDHEYDLISVYNNTSSSDQDAMAMMYVYMKDNQYRRPDACEMISQSIN